jgi:hypothetical protein
MEVVLLWLDDLDDVLFCVASAWERLRRALLRVGLASSFALAGAESSALAAEWAAVFACIAALSVSAWFCGAALRALYYRETSLPAT